MSLSTHPRTRFMVLAAALIAMFTLAGCQTPSGYTQELAQAPGSETSIQATVVDIASGDTLLVKPVGDVIKDFSGDGVVPVRMLGVKAPHRTPLTSWNSLSCGTDESAAHLRSLFGGTSTVLITIDPEVPSLTKDGTYTGYVHSLGLDDLGQQQLSAGYAIAEESSSRRHDPQRLSDYQDTTLDSRDAHLGLWSQCG